MRISEKAVRESLVKQLEDQGASADQYVDLVNDYMKLRKVKEQLIADIKKRGVTYQEESSTHVPMWKTNPAVKDLATISRQMLAILREMNLTTETAGGGDKENERL